MCGAGALAWPCTRRARRPSSDPLERVRQLYLRGEITLEDFEGRVAGLLYTGEADEPEQDGMELVRDWR